MTNKFMTQNNINQLQWFVGFLEGAGSWQTNQGHSSFSIDQQDPKVLYKVKKFVGYGKVNGPYTTKTGITFYRYKIGNLKGRKRLIDMVNGKLILNKTQLNFNNFLDMHNSSLQTADQILFKPTRSLPSFEDAWFSGYIDAKGSFSGFLTKDKKSGEYVRATVRFAVVQASEKETFEHLKNIFGGSVQYTKTNEMYRLKIESIKAVTKLIKYLDKFPLHSTKTIPFKRFKKIHIRITDGKFKWRLESRRAKERLFNLVKNINNDN